MVNRHEFGLISSFLSISQCPEICLKGLTKPILEAERSEARVCSRSPAGIAGSNPAGGMGVCLL